MSLFDDAKRAVRVSDGTDDFDFEVHGLIWSALAAMTLAGIRPDILDEDLLSDVDYAKAPEGLAKQAVIFYVKAHFGYDNEERPQFIDCYNRTVTALELSAMSNVECWRTSMADCEVADIGDMEYTGATVRPVPKVTFDGRPLVHGTDFTLRYSGNVEPGTATVYIEGTGSYAGVASKDFRIVGEAA